MFTMAGWYESADGEGVLHYVKAIPDQHLTVEDDDIRVPRDWPNIQGKAVLSAASTLTSARFEAPSLTRFVYPDIEPLVNDVIFGDSPQVSLDPAIVTPLLGDESLRLAINSDDAGAVKEYGLVWFSDGPRSKSTGSIFPVRATSVVSLSAGEWVNGPLIFGQSLPYGDYDIVGMRAVGANLIAARLVFTGLSNRPGVAAVSDIDYHDKESFRWGSMGVFGRFNSNTPPRVDCLGVTDTSQVFIFDLIKVG